jgi:cyclase
VVALGGAGRLQDFGDAAEAGAAGVAAGSMFVFHGPHRAVLITYPERKALQALLP